MSIALGFSSTKYWQHFNFDNLCINALGHLGKMVCVKHAKTYRQTNEEDKRGCEYSECYFEITKQYQTAKCQVEVSVGHTTQCFNVNFALWSPRVNVQDNMSLWQLLIPHTLRHRPCPLDIVILWTPKEAQKRESEDMIQNKIARQIQIWSCAPFLFACFLAPRGSLCCS